MKQFSNLQKSDFEKILQEYSIGKYKSHKYLEWTLDNYVYIFKTTKGKFILKILKKINYKKYLKQLEFIDYLESKKIPVAKNIHSNNGKELLILAGKHYVIQKFIKGKPMWNVGNEMSKEMGNILGNMHKILLKSKYCIKNKIHKYQKEKFK